MQNKLFKSSFSHSPSIMVKQNWIYVTSVSHYRHMADDIPFYRNHAQGFQMFFTVSGQGWLDYDGNYQTILPGTITCLDLRRRHGIGAEPGNIWDHYWLLCHGKAFEDIYSLLFNKKNIQTLQTPSQVGNLMRQLYLLKQRNPVYFDIAAMATIMQICSALQINQASSSDAKQDIFSVTLKDIIGYINDNYFNEISVSALAEKAGYSRFHFSRLFKEHTGFSPGSYITKIRLEKAKDLLSKSELSLEIISEKTGFSSVNYFIRAFKEHESITPGKYRKLHTF